MPKIERVDELLGDVLSEEGVEKRVEEMWAGVRAENVLDFLTTNCSFWQIIKVRSAGRASQWREKRTTS